MLETTSNFANDDQIKLIRKLLQRAEGAAKLGNQAEADTYNEKAAELIAKYGVDQALLAAEGKIEDPILSRHVTLDDDWTADRRGLIFAIVRALKAKAVYNQKLKPGTYQSYTTIVHVFAHQSDLERILFLYELLAPQMIVGAAAARAPYGENARSYRKSWMNGFTAAIQDRLDRSEKKAATEAGTGTDLVLFDRSTAVEQRFNDTYAPKSIRKTTRTLRGTGRASGYSAGSRANIGNTVGGGRTAIAR